MIGSRDKVQLDRPEPDTHRCGKAIYATTLSSQFSVNDESIDRLACNKVMDLRCPRTKGGRVPEKRNQIAQEGNPVRDGYWVFPITLVPECKA